MLASTNGMLNSTQRFWNIAALLSRKTGKPVIYKMTLEEYGIYKSRESDIVRVRMGGKKDSTVTALGYNQLHDNGGYGYKGATGQSVHELFRDASVSYNAFGVCTNKLSTGCIRGVGNLPQTMALVEAFDILAEKLGLDPINMWKRNHFTAEDPIYRWSGPGKTLSSDGYNELIDKGAETIQWNTKWKGWGKPYKVIGSKKRGVGMGLSSQSAGVAYLPATAIVEVNHDGTAQVLAGSIDLGTGCKTTFAQICAEALGLEFKDVSVVKDIDTEIVPWACMTGASISLFVEGSCVKLAAMDAKRQILEMSYTAPWTPDILKKGIESSEDLDIKDSRVYVKADPSRCAMVKDVVGSVLAPIVMGRAQRHGLSTIGPQPKASLAGFADVEVDVETGRVTVLKLILGHDSGQLINPEICLNQVYGGALMSYGYGLMEEVVFDPATGKVLNPALTDYRVPTSLDVPPMEIIFSDIIDPIGPFGAKGIGEAPTAYPHAIIASAVYNAAGVRISELPITPDKVLKALKEKQAQG